MNYSTIALVPVGRAPHPDHYTSMVKLIARTAAEGFPLVDFLPLVGNPNLPRTRNALAARALTKSDAEWLFWCDDDIGFEPDAFFALFERDPDKKIIGGVLQVRDEHEIRFNWYPDRPVEPDADGHVTGLVGTGFLLTHRSVFEKVSGTPIQHRSMSPKENAVMRRWFEYETVERDGLTIDDGEDYTFMRKARAAGVEVYCHPGLALRHHTDKTLNKRPVDFFPELAPRKTEEAAA